MSLADDIRDVGDQYESDREAIEAFIREHPEVQAAQYALERLPRSNIKLHPDGYDNLVRVRITTDAVGLSNLTSGAFRSLSDASDRKLVALAEYVRSGECGQAVLDAAEEIAGEAREGAAPLRG